MQEPAGAIRFNTPETAAFVKTATTYGRIKYAIVEQAWRIHFIGRDAGSSGNSQSPQRYNPHTAIHRQPLVGHMGDNGKLFFIRYR